MEKRPTRHDPAVVAAAVKVIAEDVCQWLRDAGEDDQADNERASIEKQLADAARYADDGFEIAHRLKSHHYWECDSELVEILENYWWEADNAKDAAVAEWVKRNNVTVPYLVGDKVKVKPNAWRRGQGHVGEVVEVDAEHAIVHVFIATLGHVREGNGTNATLLSVEELEFAEEPVREPLTDITGCDV